VEREPHEIQHDLPFLSVMVAIAWANRLKIISTNCNISHSL